MVEAVEVDETDATELREFLSEDDDEDDEDDDENEPINKLLMNISRTCTSSRAIVLGPVSSRISSLKI
ncbi:hypothetical protein BGZ70_010680, partial [Mortierella alpina]